MSTSEVTEIEPYVAPAPIEDKPYLNYYQYLRERLIESYGEEKVLKYENTPIIEMALSILVGDELTDGFIIRTLNHANIELLKDSLIKDTLGEGKLSDVSVIDYYAVMKDDPSESIGQSDAISYAEEMVSDFYNFLFNEIMGGQNG